MFFIEICVTSGGVQIENATIVEAPEVKDVDEFADSGLEMMNFVQ